MGTIAGYAMRESIRRRVFLVVLLLTIGFLGLYTFGAAEAFHATGDLADNEYGVDAHDLTGTVMLALSMFATLFLGAVLAIFLTLGVVRGDAERGLLQPLVVRPVGRSALLTARFAGAAAVGAGYVVAVFLASVAITAAVGDWTPDHIVLPALEMAAAVCVIALLSLMGSVFLSTTANGIAIFMVYGAGLTAGLLGQIADALDSGTLDTIARTASWALPFEALYQDALYAITSQTTGFTRTALNLGPFGGAQDAGPLLWLFALAYVGVFGAIALEAFRRRDL